MDLTNSEPLLNAIVLVGSNLSLKIPPLPKLEDQIGSIIQATEGILGPTGAGTAIRIRKHNIEVVVSPGKWEFNSNGEQFDESLADYLAEVVEIFVGMAASPEWRMIGYNFNIVSQATEEDLPAKQIAKMTIDVPGVEKRLGHQVVGASSALFFLIGDTRLWLRLEPRGGDRDARRLWVYGNFDQPISEGTLTKESMEREFTQHYSKFKEIMEKL